MTKSGKLWRGYIKVEYFLLCVLLFLLPLGTVKIEHWISGIFSLLCLLALIGLPKNITILSRDERLLILSVFLIYLSFLQATALHGWNKEIGAQIRFFFFIPLFLLLKTHPTAGAWLLRGTIVALLVIFIQSIYDIEIKNLSRSNGFYGPLFIGSIAGIFSVIALSQVIHMGLRSAWGVFALIMFLFGVYSTFVSVSRAGILILVAGVIALIAISGYRRAFKFAVLAVGVGVSVFSYFAFDRVKYEVHRPLNEIEKFVSIDEPAEFGGNLGSTGERLTFWKTSLLIIGDNPIVGVGMLNYKKEATDYVRQGKVNKEAIIASHPHNMFLEIWVTRGLLGIASLFMLILVSYRIYFRNYKESKETTLVGLIHLTGIVIFGVFESAPVLKGNYVAFFMIYLAVFIAWSQHTARHNKTDSNIAKADV